MKQAIEQANEVLVSDFKRFLLSEGLAETTVRVFVIGARHLLRWLQNSDIELRSIDDAILRSFRDHRCSCPVPSTWSSQYKKNAKPSRKTFKGALRFVSFLENMGHVTHPGDLALARDLLRNFRAHLTTSGYSHHTLTYTLVVATHFLAWLHISRRSVQAVSLDTIDAFVRHDCVCPIKTMSRVVERGSDYYALSIRSFVKFLVAGGYVSDAASLRKPDPLEKYSKFAEWLLSRRDITEKTCREYLRYTSMLVSHLPSDSRCFDAVSIRKALSSCAVEYSPTTVRALATSLRFYLRYLAAQGQCEIRLLEAIPTVPDWSQSRLPRYLSKQDVELVVESCDVGTPQGIRDRSILLLLARLGLRAGDIVQMEFDHIDWSRARILFSGKSLIETWLPLPQDAGDALLEYLEFVRPRVDCPAVFLRMRAPYTGFRSSQNIGEIVRNAIIRSGVDSPGCRGAYVLRHSFATNKLRDKMPFDRISKALRHRSLDTTMTYAKGIM